MNKCKKILLFAVSGIMAVNLISICSVSAGDYQYATGDNDMSQSEMEEFSRQFSYEDPDANDNESNIYQLPTSVDLSTSKYFPPIGDQGGIGSCVSWATTYYQFTYEAHKLNNIVTTSTNSYSPTWTYNFTNGGGDYGSNINYAYNVLKNQGALTLADMPYNKTKYNYSWSTDTEAMTNALKTRASVIDRITISSKGTCITNNKDSDLVVVKSLLNSGKVFTIRTYSELGLMNWSTKEAYNNPNELVAYRAYKVNSGHAMTVVGYDDTICCDVNGNGIIEDFERGAFKVANSWGTNWGNNGYIWVLYDALNQVSANKSNNWESDEYGERVPIFHKNDIDGNVFYYINVDNYDINMVGQLTINTSNKNKLGVMITRGDSQVNSMKDTITYFYNNNIKYINLTEASGFNGTLVFDYTDFITPINLCSYGYYYGVKINNYASMHKDTFTDLSYKLVDELSNTICDFNSLSPLSNGSSYTLSQKLQLQKGDVNYDGVLNSDDVDYLINYVLQVNELSNIQYYLADCSGDNLVNSVDIVVLNKMLK